VRWTDRVLTVVGLSLALALPAAAQPPFEPPPQVMRPDFQIRSSTDGRADLHETPVARPELPAPAQRAAPEIMAHKDVQLPIRNDVALRARPGDDGENASQAQLPQAQATTPAPARDDRMGRAEPAPKLPLKTQIALRIEGEEGADAAPAPRGQLGAQDKSTQRMSPAQQKAFAKHTGINLPFNGEGSDDASDKAE
jgi:hypothetical protein